MEATALEQEKRYLKMSVAGNVLVGCVGIAVAAFSSSQAILLDGLFNLTYFAMGLFTVKSERPTCRRSTTQPGEG